MPNPILRRRLGGAGAGFDPRAYGTVLEYLRPPTNLADGDPIQTVPCVVGIDGSQPTLPKRPLAKLVNGRWWMRFDGVDDSISLTGLTAASGSKTYIAVIKPGRLTHNDWLLDIETGRLILYASGGSPAGNAGLYQVSGAYRNVAVATTDAQILTWKIVSGGTSTLYRNGVAIGTAAASTATAIGGAIGLGSIFGGLGDNMLADLGPFIAYDGALSDANRLAVERGFGNEYGVPVA